MTDNLIDGKNLFENVGEAAIAGAIGGALGDAGGVLRNVFVAGKRLAQLAFRFGIDTAFNIGGGTLGDLAVGNPITLEGVLIGADIGAAVSVGMGGLVKIKDVVSGKAGLYTGSRTNVEAPAAKRPELEVKDSILGVKSTETDRLSTHYGKQEITNKPGIVGEQDEVKVLQDGRGVCCSDCEEMPRKYSEIHERSDTKQQFDEIKVIPDAKNRIHNLAVVNARALAALGHQWLKQCPFPVGQVESHDPPPTTVNHVLR